MTPPPHTNNRKAVANYCDDQTLPVKLSVHSYRPENYPQINHQEILYGDQAGVTPESNQLAQYQFYQQQMDGISGADNITHVFDGTHENPWASDERFNHLSPEQYNASMTNHQLMLQMLNNGHNENIPRNNQQVTLGTQEIQQNQLLMMTGPTPQLQTQTPETCGYHMNTFF